MATATSLTPPTPARDPAGAEPHTAEAAAVAAALSGRILPRLKIGGRALARLLRDPEDTEQVLVLFLTMHARLVPKLLARFLAEPDGVALMSERPAIDSHHVDLAALRALPADTLGGAFVRHLDRYGLSPDIFQAPPGVPATIGYLGQRLRQSHDIWHVLTGYSTSVPDELALLAFSYQQTKMPGPALVAWLGALRWWPTHKDIFRHVARGWRRGQAASSLLTARWEDMWALPLDEVRARYGVVAA